MTLILFHIVSERSVYFVETSDATITGLLSFAKVIYIQILMFYLWGGLRCQHTSVADICPDINIAPLLLRITFRYNTGSSRCDVIFPSLPLLLKTKLRAVELENNSIHSKICPSL